MRTKKRAVTRAKYGHKPAKAYCARSPLGLGFEPVSSHAIDGAVLPEPMLESYGRGPGGRGSKHDKRHRIIASTSLDMIGSAQCCAGLKDRHQVAAA
jgi:hypothetical protein